MARILETRSLKRGNLLQTRMVVAKINYLRVALKLEVFRTKDMKLQIKVLIGLHAYRSMPWVKFYFLCDGLQSEFHFEVHVIGQLNSICLLVSCQLMRVFVISF